PIGPQCSVADIRMDLGRGTMFVSSQALTGVPEAVGRLTGLDPKNVRCIFNEGSSSYGTGQLPDTYSAAAAVSKAIGKPVRMQWMRWDQHGWDETGPAALWDVKAGVDSTGKIVGTDWTTYGQAGTSVKTTEELLGTAVWPSVPGNGGPTP